MNDKLIYYVNYLTRKIKIFAREGCPENINKSIQYSE